MKKIYLIILIGLCSCASHKKTDFDKRRALSLDTIDEIAARIQKITEPQVGEGKNTGAVIGIYLQGKTKFIFLGETKKGNKESPNENTIFEIGSLTKTFTGLLLSQEMESKKVKETDTIGSIQKKWATQKAGSITLLELVTHRSGLPRIPCNLDVSNMAQPYEKYTETDLLEHFQDKVLKAHPDCIVEEHPTKKINYSNLGFGTLGYILGLKEKTSYIDLLKKKILKPLEMQDTTYDLSREQLQRVAQGYDEKGNPMPMWKQPTTSAAGALRSTASDLSLFAQAYIHPDTTPISSAFLRTMHVQYEDEVMGRIGYAWMINPSGSFWMNGMTGGYASYMKIYPKREFAVFYLTNSAMELKCINEAIAGTSCKELTDSPTDSPSATK